MRGGINMKAFGKLLTLTIIGIFIGTAIVPAIAGPNTREKLESSSLQGITVVSPNGWEIWSGNNTIIWEYDLLWGCYCHFFKIYCIGNIGYKRYTLSAHWEDTDPSDYASFLWDTWNVPNDKYKIKIELWCHADWQCQDNPTLIATDTSDNYFTVHNNYPPTIDSIEGPRYGRSDTPYEYTIYGSDKDNDHIYYKVDWGDGTSNITGFYPQTEPTRVSHIWNNEGTYDIIISACDGNAWSKNNKTVKMTIDDTPPNIEIKKPKNGLYIFDRGPFPMSSPLIIGDITIKIEGTDSGSGISYAEFYIDNELKYTDMNKPLEWHWDEHAVFTHKIKVIVYDNVGYTSEKEINVLIFNL